MKESEQNFEELKQLLKLKRHEIPPPGYFHNFSSGVIAGIRDEQNGGATARLNSEASWLTRFLRVFETRPGWVGGFATSLVLVLVFGVVLADRSDSDTQNIFSTDPAAQTSSPMMASANMSTVSTTPDLASAGSDSSGGISVSTNPVTSLQPVATLFGQANPLFQSASFAPAH
jgi:hypothetical protein